MGKLVGSGSSDNYGERTFIEIAKRFFDDSTIIYWNRQIYGREFDICILLPDKGILIVEVKGWREENILRIENNDAVIISTVDGEVASSPQRQARSYRFSLERLIKHNFQHRPLVFQMVCLPQVTKQFFTDKRLDVVMEERFTFLEEDLVDKASFFDKLNQALREVTLWNREPFDSRMMLEIRTLFEADIELGETDESSNDLRIPSIEQFYDYSRFYFCSKNTLISEDVIREMISQYMLGCKLYCVFQDRSEMLAVITAMDAALTQRGLVRNRNHISFSLEDQCQHYPAVSGKSDTFTTFHCSMSVCNGDLDETVSSFVVKNGIADEHQKELMVQLSAVSQFNIDQYYAEHSDPEKHIVIRAGAGTGKTYTMISRIGYICYTQNVPLRKMVERIVMITFTQQATEQMEEELKSYFRNCYLLTSRPEYLEMVSGIDHMQISTIHSYAKLLISKLGTSFGYGIDVRVTSSEYNRTRKVNEILDQYIKQQQRNYGLGYIEKLGMPIYAIRDYIIEFIGKLHNKSIDIGALQPEDFGTVLPDCENPDLHNLLSTVIPKVEQEYYQELLEDNRLHLGSMMSLLNRFICAPESRDRIVALKAEKDALQFMFVDEFQDTDDTQIDILTTLAHLLNYRLFVVGDIKQCIYRFRGAQEKAFDHLHIEAHPEQWQEYSLRRNYRTDKTLLELYDKSFSIWGQSKNDWLTYDAVQDRLSGTREYNGYLLSSKNRFFTRITADNDTRRMYLLAEEIKQIQRRIQYEEKRLGMQFTAKEKSICILVRENWQAEMIRESCARIIPNISIRTDTGGDLYMSQPALDMMTLVNALVHYDEAEYLYQLITSHFFQINVPRSNLYELRQKMRRDGMRSKENRFEQVNYLISLMNPVLSNNLSDEKTWESIVVSLRTKPVLQVLKSLYGTLRPWLNYSTDEWKQHYYQLNVDLLFEQLINTCNIDRITINTLQEHLFTCITSRVQVDSRAPKSERGEAPIQCITVHKSKGLEYGHVILPFCSAPMNVIKKDKLHVSAVKQSENYKIGYRMKMSESGKVLQNDYYNENVEIEEKTREEARILYVAMTRAIRSFSWIELQGKRDLSWQSLIQTEG